MHNIIGLFGCVKKLLGFSWHFVRIVVIILTIYVCMHNIIGLFGCVKKLLGFSWHFVRIVVIIL
jgi:hypothetical protein